MIRITLTTILLNLCIGLSTATDHRDSHRESYVRRDPRTVEDDILGLLKRDGSPSLVQRDFTSSLHLLTWSAVLPSDGGSAETKYNISLAVGGCKLGARFNTFAGAYTLSNGSTKPDATVGDIATDLKAIQRSAPSRLDAEYALGNHTYTMAKAVAEASNALLNDHLLCRDTVKHTGEEIIHDELRHLLRDRQQVKSTIREAGVLLLASTIAGALGGIISGWGAAYNLYIDSPELDTALVAVGGFLSVPGNGFGIDSVVIKTLYGANQASVSKYEHDNRIAKLQARNNGIMAGVTTFFATLSAGIVTAYMSHRRRMRADEALSADVLLAAAKHFLDKYNADLAAQAARGAQITGSIVSWTASRASASSPSSSVPSAPAIGGTSCVNPADAAAYAASLDQVDSAALGLPPLGDIGIMPEAQAAHQLHEVLIGTACQAGLGL